MELQLNKIICGDNREVMKNFPSDSIDLVVTSPPYWGLRDYGIGPKQLGQEDHPQEFIDNLVTVFQEVKRVLKSTGSFWLNLGDTYCHKGGSDKGGNDKSILGEKTIAAQRRARFNGEFTNWLQPKQKLMMPHRVAIALQDDGWILRNDVIWHKTNHMPESVQDRLTKSYENIFFFVKERKYYFDLDAIRVPSTTQPWSNISTKDPYIENNPRKYVGKYDADIAESVSSPRARQATRDTTSYYNPKGKNPGDVWDIPTKPFPGSHFAVFPPDLINPIIKAACPEDGIVLDPFAGSGTALRVARKLNRSFIGIEINPEFAAMAEERVRSDKYSPAPEGVPKLSTFSKSLRMNENGS